jgi:iron transport multicopper oxidase
MVIYDPNDPQKSLYDVDDETTIITLADWYHIKAPDAPFVIFADSHLINGKGRYVGGPASPLSVMTVQPGKRYRFRLVAMSCEANYVFSVDGHPLTIIEADGVNTKPLQVDSLQIFSGQRYSVVLNANQAVKNYWIRALPNNGPPGTSDGFNSAILRYSGAPNSDPTTVQVASTSPLRETDLHPLANTPAPGAPHIGGADIQLNLNLDFDYGAFKFTVNGKAYASPSVPVLLQILSGASTAQDLMPAGSVIDLPRNKVIEVTLPGGVPGGPHPFHLHGHSFSVVRSAGSSSYNYANPVIRDVVSTGDVGDNTTIRFVTNNPGPWFLHCHVNWHLENGMAVIFSENAQYFSRRDDPSSDTDSDAQRRRPPFDWQGLCPAYNALSSDQH